MAIDIRQGGYPHIYWIDLEQNGTLTECAVMKQDGNGNIYYFTINSLDSIDKRRLMRIIRNRNAQSFELWDLMSNITLNNGINALEYFHQLVKVMTPYGVHMNPRTGVIGAERPGTVDTRPTAEQVSQQAAAQQQAAPQPAQPAPPQAPTQVEEQAQPTTQQVTGKQAGEQQAPQTNNQSRKKTSSRKSSSNKQ